VAAAFSHLAARNGMQGKVILTDADVDASNLELVLAPQVLESHEFLGGKVAVIDQDQCDQCGICAEVCRFNAIQTGVSAFEVDPIACEGCGACVYQCPGSAIHLETQVAGEWFRSESRYGPLFHAALLPAQENSGKLVTMVKQQARLQAMDAGSRLVLVDGPPGIGCPVISAVSGVDLALIVAEPTAAGVHDMRRVLETTDHFGVRTVVCINKADIYAEGAAKIEAFCRDNGIRIVGRIPFDALVTEAMVQGQAVTAYAPDAPASQALSDVWAEVCMELEVEG
jgi:MinD superfamily P-loop ATPase